jgi:hypothetical protein
MIKEALPLLLIRATDSKTAFPLGINPTPGRELLSSKT